jgi:hypothetical protein
VPQEVGCHAVCDTSPLTASQNEIQEDGFDEELIYELLEYLIFDQLGVEYVSRFNGLYPLSAIAYVCTAVGLLLYYRNGIF